MEAVSWNYKLYNIRTNIFPIWIYHPYTYMYRADKWMPSIHQCSHVVSGTDAKTDIILVHIYSLSPFAWSIYPLHTPLSLHIYIHIYMYNFPPSPLHYIDAHDSVRLSRAILRKGDDSLAIPLTTSSLVSRQIVSRKVVLALRRGENFLYFFSSFLPFSYTHIYIYIYLHTHTHTVYSDLFFLSILSQSILQFYSHWPLFFSISNFFFYIHFTVLDLLLFNSL